MDINPNARISQFSPGSVNILVTEAKNKESFQTMGTLLQNATMKDYPAHGIIGCFQRDWLPFFNPSENPTESRKDFRKQKFDFHETYEKKADINEQKCSPIVSAYPPMPGLWGAWSMFNNETLPSNSFQNEINQSLVHAGYGHEKAHHPFFQTTSSVYGKFPPALNDNHKDNYALNTTFTAKLASTGMPKNRSLNIK